MDQPFEQGIAQSKIIHELNIAELTASEIAAALAKYPCHFNWEMDEKAFNEKMDENLRICLTHLNSSPTDITVHNFLGYIYCIKKDFAKARSHFNQCQALRPADQVSLANLAYCYLRQGNIIAAREKLQLLQQMPINDETRGLQHWSHAYAYVRLFQYAKAEEQYVLAQKHITDPRLFVLRGILCNRERRYRDALTILSLANKDGYSDYLLFTHIGRALGGLKQYQQAIEYFERACNTVPNDMGVIQQFYGKMLRAMGQDQQALKLLSAAIVSQPTTYAYHQRGLLQLKSTNTKVKNRTKAEADFRQAIKLRETNFYAVTNLIQMLLDKGDHVSFVEVLDLCVRYEQTFIPKATLFYLWGRCLAELKNMPSAEEKFLMALSRDDDDDDTLSYYRHAYNWLKQYYLNQHRESNVRRWHILRLRLEVLAHNHDSAITLFDAVQRECSDMPELYFWYGQALLAVDRNMDAIAAFKKAKELYVADKEKRNCDHLIATALLQQIEQESDMHRVTVYCLDVLQYSNVPAQLTQAYTTMGTALAQIIKKLPKEDTHYRVAAFVLDGLSGIEGMPDSIAAKQSVYETLGLFREASSECVRLGDQPAIQRCNEATNQEATQTFSSDTQKVLADLRLNYLKLKMAELKSDMVVQKELVNKLIEDGRKLLDYLFINFLKTKIHSADKKLMGAFFPCVPESKDSKYSLDERLQQYLTSRTEQRWIGLANPKVNFPKLYGFLLAIQPLLNKKYQWLRTLYDSRNKIAHETQLELIMDIDATKINASAFVEQFFFGVQNIIRDFYRAYAEDAKVPVPPVPMTEAVDESAFFMNVLDKMNSIIQANTAAKQQAAKENSPAKPAQCTPPAPGSIAAPGVLFPPDPTHATLPAVVAPLHPILKAAAATLPK